MFLTDAEKAMRDGAEGPAVAAAMDLLLRYGVALDASRLCDIRNVAGTIFEDHKDQRDPRSLPPGERLAGPDCCGDCEGVQAQRKHKGKQFYHRFRLSWPLIRWPQWPVRLGR